MGPSEHQMCTFGILNQLPTCEVVETYSRYEAAFGTELEPVKKRCQRSFTVSGIRTDRNLASGTGVAAARAPSSPRCHRQDGDGARKTTPNDVTIREVALTLEITGRPANSTQRASHGSGDSGARTLRFIVLLSRRHGLPQSEAKTFS